MYLSTKYIGNSKFYLLNETQKKLNNDKIKCNNVVKYIRIIKVFSQKKNLKFKDIASIFSHFVGYLSKKKLLLHFKLKYSEH